jgi:hypothetical protein
MGPGNLQQGGALFSKCDDVANLVTILFIDGQP